MKTFEVKILGQRYKIRSDEDEEYIQQLAKFVNERLIEVQKGTRSVASYNVAILAALNIADSLHKQKEEKDQLEGEVKERIGRILKWIRSKK
jgi:cell division protein ZapA